MYKAPQIAQINEHQPLTFLTFAAEDTTIGYTGAGFHFDNEVPAYGYHLPAFSFANRLITNAEFLEFMNDGGYRTPDLWLADGWNWKETNHVTQPLYWIQQDGVWCEYTLYGLLSLNPELLASHINYYEADAYARWLGKRLPTEQEWERVCRQHKHTLEHRSTTFHPQAEKGSGDIV